MAIYNSPAVRPTVIYSQKNTKNTSFMNMHIYLKEKGIINNEFFLALVDPDLANIDPRDPNLSFQMKQKVFRECKINFWYFIREVVRIPDQGGDVKSGVMYELHRGNLAMNFGFVHNWSMFVEFPRQNYKTISAVCWYLWVFIFGTTNSEIMFANKKHEDSKLNLTRLKQLRAALPEYLRMDQPLSDATGKKIKAVDKQETLENASTKNKIKTMASARNKASAMGLGRGCTMPVQWYDEFAFMPYIAHIYNSASPAYNTAALNAIRNRAPHGILITTTPGILTTDEGQFAFDLREMCTHFGEHLYDLNDAKLNEYIRKNENTFFVHMRFTYQQLGRSEQWFKDICIVMLKKWDDIRREVLLEWSSSSDNCPFSKTDLNKVKTMVRPPIRTVTVANYYQLNIYDELTDCVRYPPIMGVDVSGGYKRDASAITIINSKTTSVVATLNCNYISPGDLAKVIHEIVTKYLPNCIVNIERNGGYGASVLGLLVKSSIKKNLYYEIKDKITEERVSNGRIVKSKQRTKIYGLDSSQTIRDMLIEILRERMENHKDKFVAEIIFNELEGLERNKKTGRVDHSSNTHDDQIFSYLMALYVWYEGKDVETIFNLTRLGIKTDSDLDEAITSFEDKYTVNLAAELAYDDEVVQEQLEMLKDTSISFEEWRKQEAAKDEECGRQLLMTPLGKKAFKETFPCNDPTVHDNATVKIPDSIFNDFYN